MEKEKKKMEKKINKWKKERKNLEKILKNVMGLPLPI